jgi:alpha-1,4-digalacturonate transport system substrate-binding protein
MTQLTVTGPYVNKTLFEQAGSTCRARARPGTTGRWRPRKWPRKLDIPIPMAWDRSGHRVAGPAISMGAKMFDADGEPGAGR